MSAANELGYLFHAHVCCNGRQVTSVDGRVPRGRIPVIVCQRSPHASKDDGPGPRLKMIAVQRMERAEGEGGRVHLLHVREESRAPWRLAVGHCAMVVVEMAQKLSCASGRRCRRIHGETTWGCL